MYYHKPQEKPCRWGNFQDVQYAIRKNAEKIYQIDPDSMVFTAPLFWGLPLLDYSGKNNHGINHGATYKDKRLDFGTTGYISVSDNDSLSIDNGAMSISAWIKLDFDTTGPAKFILDKTIDNLEAYRLFFHSSIDDFRFRLFTSAGAVNCDISGGSWDIGTWHHIIGTYDGTNMRIYWDDVLKTTTAQSGNITTNNDDLTIGAQAGTLLYSFEDGISEVCISKVAYTADQIALQYDRPWALYQPVSRPVYFFQATIESFIPQITMF